MAMFNTPRFLSVPVTYILNCLLWSFGLSSCHWLFVFLRMALSLCINSCWMAEALIDMTLYSRTCFTTINHSSIFWMTLKRTLAIQSMVYFQPKLRKDTNNGIIQFRYLSLIRDTRSLQLIMIVHARLRSRITTCVQFAGNRSYHALDLWIAWELSVNCMRRILTGREPTA